MPALLTSTSTSPIASKVRVTAASSVTSQTCVVDAERWASAAVVAAERDHPLPGLRRSARTAARPMPLEPPVTTTVRALTAGSASRGTSPAR